MGFKATFLEFHFSWCFAPKRCLAPMPTLVEAVLPLPKYPIFFLLIFHMPKCPCPLLIACPAASSKQPWWKIPGAEDNIFFCSWQCGRNCQGSQNWRKQKSHPLSISLLDFPLQPHFRNCLLTAPKEERVSAALIFLLVPRRQEEHQHTGRSSQVGGSWVRWAPTPIRHLHQTSARSNRLTRPPGATSPEQDHRRLAYSQSTFTQIQRDNHLLTYLCGHWMAVTFLTLRACCYFLNFKLLV